MVPFLRFGKGVMIEYIKAIKTGNLEYCQTNIQKIYIDWQCPKTGDSLLHIASEFEQVDIVRLLIDNGISLSLTNKNNFTAFWYSKECSTQCHNLIAEALCKKQGFDYKTVEEFSDCSSTELIEDNVDSNEITDFYIRAFSKHDNIEAQEIDKIVILGNNKVINPGEDDI